MTNNNQIVRCYIFRNIHSKKFNLMITSFGLHYYLVVKERTDMIYVKVYYVL